MMAQVSKQDFRQLQQYANRGFLALNARILELQLTVEAQALAIHESLGLTAAQAKRYRDRVDDVYRRIRGAQALGQMLANWGTHVVRELEEGGSVSLAELGAMERAADEAAGLALELTLLDINDLVEPEPQPAPPPEPRGWLARRLGRHAA
ncbi:MAG: hypothetical protein ABI624_16660 [Casimicrobiaceae bacterium]